MLVCYIMKKNLLVLEEWLGGEYSSLPHFNIEKEKKIIFLHLILFLYQKFLFTMLMTATKKLPCQKSCYFTKF